MNVIIYTIRLLYHINDVELSDLLHAINGEGYLRSQGLHPFTVTVTGATVL
jgi:hypothetical protein